MLKILTLLFPLKTKQFRDFAGNAQLTQTVSAGALQMEHLDESHLHCESFSSFTYLHLIAAIHCGYYSRLNVLSCICIQTFVWLNARYSASCPRWSEVSSPFIHVLKGFEGLCSIDSCCITSEPTHSFIHSFVGDKGKGNLKRHLSFARRSVATRSSKDF